jgi:hypothetical protein
MDQGTDKDIVAEGVAALKAFGTELELADAIRLLPQWHYADRLTADERTAILEHFIAPDPADAAIVALLRMLERYGISRQVLADMTDLEQAAVFAAEARIRGRAR